MADATTASIHPLVQPRPAVDTALTQRPKSGAERARLYRARKKAGKPVQTDKSAPSRADNVPLPALVKATTRPVTLDVTPAAPVTVKKDGAVLSSIALRAAAFALAAVGLSMNAVYARSLGSSDLSGWLFLALGVASDAAALTLPTVAASTWNRGHSGSALAAWATWLVVFAFAILGAVGFASTSISDTVTARASRVTPVILTAQAALADAMRSRDLECKGGVGRFCREREAAVVEARQVLAGAVQNIERSADPQTAAATALVSWMTHGAMQVSADDIAMVRLLLLALLPQVGGILLMVAGRRA